MTITFISIFHHFIYGVSLVMVWLRQKTHTQCAVAIETENGYKCEAPSAPWRKMNLSGRSAHISFAFCFDSLEDSRSPQIKATSGISCNKNRRNNKSEFGRQARHSTSPTRCQNSRISFYRTVLLVVTVQVLARIKQKANSTTKKNE